MYQNSVGTIELAACRTRLRARQERHYQAREQQRLTVLQALGAAAGGIFSRFPPVQRAYLFGTVLRPGALRATADIDIAVDGRLSAEDSFALWRLLEQVGGYRPLDLVELDRDTPFAERRGGRQFGRTPSLSASLP